MIFYEDGELVYPTSAIVSSTALTGIHTLKIIEPRSRFSSHITGGPAFLIPKRFLFLQTHNVDELAEKLSWSRPHQIKLAASRTKHTSRVSYVPLTEMTIGELSFTGKGQDSLGSAESAFILLLGIGGMAAQRMNKTDSELSPMIGAVHSPGQTSVISIGNHLHALSVSIQQRAILRELENHLGHPVNGRVEFTPTLNMASLGGMRVWQNTLALSEILNRHSHMPQTLLATRDAQRSMISHMVESHRHNYTRLMHRTVMAGPWQVRAAEEFMRANPAEPLTIGDLAVIAGVSARALQHSFRQHRGISPMQFLRSVRLQCVHDDLLWGDGVRTVAEAAAKWGFFHFGRFAATYARRYGESPSATLKKNWRRV